MRSRVFLALVSLSLPLAAACRLPPASKVSWDPAFAGTFKARLLVKSEDSPGVLAKVATAIAGLEGNISKAEAAMLAEGRAKIRLDIRIRDIRHLDDITKRISALKEVLSVERV